MDKLKKMVLRLSGDRIINTTNNINNCIYDRNNNNNNNNNFDNKFYICIFKNKTIWNVITSFLKNYDSGCKRYYEIIDAVWITENHHFQLLKYKLKRYLLQLQQQDQISPPLSPLRKLSFSLSSNIISSSPPSRSSSPTPMITTINNISSTNCFTIPSPSLSTIEKEPEIINWNRNCFEIIYKYSNDLELIKIIHSKRLKKKLKEYYRDIVEAIDYSSENGNLEITKYFHEISGMKATKAAITMAAKNGHLEIVSFLHEHRQEGCTKQAMDEASKNGHLEVVKYLYEHRQEGCTIQALDEASKNGHIEVVEFLLSNKLDELLHIIQRDHLDSPIKAIDHASHSGHLKIVKLLHQSLSTTAFSGCKICTIYAMDGAASIGDLELVKFLHFNRQEGCSKMAMNSAAIYGHIDVVRFLHFNRPEGCTETAINQASSNRGSFECIKFLIENRKEGFHKSAIINAAESNQMEILELLYQNIDKLHCTNNNNTQKPTIATTTTQLNNKKIEYFINFNYNPIVKLGYYSILKFLYEISLKNSINNNNFNLQLIDIASGYKRIDILEFLYGIFNSSQSKNNHSGNCNEFRNIKSNNTTISIQFEII